MSTYVAELSSCGVHCSPETVASVFFFNDTATTEIYTLSLHDALPIFGADFASSVLTGKAMYAPNFAGEDRKSTRLNSSHVSISYAVFCLKKKNTNIHRAEHSRADIGAHGSLQLRGIV